MIKCFKEIIQPEGIKIPGPLLHIQGIPVSLKFQQPILYTDWKILSYVLTETLKQLFLQHSFLKIQIIYYLLT